MKIAIYTTSTRKREASSKTSSFPSRAAQWDECAVRHPETEITLVAQLNGRYFIDIDNGKITRFPEHVAYRVLPMEAGIMDFVHAIEELKPDLAVAMSGPNSGYDWNPIRDTEIAEELRARGIKTVCMPVETALTCFDKARTAAFLRQNGFKAAESIAVSHELYTTQKGMKRSTCNAYREYVLWAAEKLGLPVIIKPTTGSASAGVVICRANREIEDYLDSDAFEGDVLIERFLKGDEYGFEIHARKDGYDVLPPFRLEKTETGDVNDPIGLSTIKYGPLTSKTLAIEEARGELVRLANLMCFTGITQVDMMKTDEGWYVIEINTRWSGMSSLTAAAENRRQYDIYVDQLLDGRLRYDDPENLTCACQFKVSDADDALLEKLCADRNVSSAFRCEMNNGYTFAEIVISGFDSIRAMADKLQSIQQTYPAHISPKLHEALYRASSMT